MAESLMLPLLLLVPIAGALAVALAGRASTARALAMTAMLVVLAVAIALFAGFDGVVVAARPALDIPWMPSLGIDLSFGVDGFNVYLVLLTGLLFPVVLACAWSSDEAQRPFYLVLLLAMQAGLLGTFLAQNLVVLFVLWEDVLIPMVLLILVFGGAKRRRAAMAFFLYTMASSVLFLAAVILLGVESQRQTGHWSFDLAVLAVLDLDPATQAFVFGAIALACAVKSPLFPFHSWLPLAYGEAPASGTALMAGVMSKMGAFGFLKLAIPLAPAAAAEFAPLMIALAVTSILYGAVLALRQQDFRQLVAYASLSHMGYIVLGLFSFAATGVHGAMIQMLSHGLVVSGLFLMLGLLEQRCGAAYLNVQALSTHAPRFAVVLMLFILASLALPMTSGFTAEFLVLLGAFTTGLSAAQAGGGSGMLVAAVLACAGVVLGATYMLRMARRLLFGDAGAPAAPLRDLEARETLALAPLLALVLWVGLWPAPLMARVETAVTRIAVPTQVSAPTRHVLGAAHAR